MTLDNTSIVDAAGIESGSGVVVLTIADAWDWDDTPTHLAALQNKLNSYFEFVESGQIWESFPARIGGKIRIDIIGRFLIPAAAQELIRQANEVAAELKLTVCHREYRDSSP